MGSEELYEQKRRKRGTVAALVLVRPAINMKQDIPYDFRLSKIQAYLAIRSARNRDPGKRGNKKAKSTKQEYMRVFKRFGKIAANPALVLAQLNSSKRLNTWYKNRAALIFGYRGLFSLYNSKEAICSSAHTLEELIFYNKNLRKCITAVLNASPPEDISRVVNTKKKQIGKYPKEWRTEIWGRMPKYRDSIAVLAITGCRSAELAIGVKIGLKSGDERSIYLTIKGTKLTSNSGQDRRTITIPAIDPMSQYLHEQVCLNDCKEIIVSINRANSFSSAIRSAGRRAFRKLEKKKLYITSNSFRHQLAADYKLVGAEGFLTEVMGHQSIDTKEHYGYYQNGTGGVTLATEVEVSTPIRRSGNRKSYKQHLR